MGVDGPGAVACPDALGNSGVEVTSFDGTVESETELVHALRPATAIRIAKPATIEGLLI